MPKEEKFTCDECGKDLTENHSGYEVSRIVVTAEMVPKTSNISFGGFGPEGLGGYPNLCFCRLGCLVEWSIKEKEKWDKAKAESETVHGK